MTKIYIGTFQVKASFYRSTSQYLWSTSRFRSVTNSISRYRLVSDTLGVKSADSASATEDPKRRIVPSKVNNPTHMPQCSAATMGYNVAFFRGPLYRRTIVSRTIACIRGANATAT